MRLATVKTSDGQRMAIPPDRYMVMESNGKVGLYHAGEVRPDRGIALDGKFDDIVAELNSALRDEVPS